MKKVKKAIYRRLFFLVNKIFPSYEKSKLGNVIKNIFARHFISKVGEKCHWGKISYIENDISIDDYSGIGNQAFIQEPVQIGKFVMMAQNVKIYRKNHNMYMNGIPMCQQGYTQTEKLVIEDDVWIGDSVIILPKVHYIGKGSVLGAYSVVTKDVEPYSIVGGNPAKKIGSRFNGEQNENSKIHH